MTEWEGVIATIRLERSSREIGAESQGELKVREIGAKVVATSDGSIVSVTLKPHSSTDTDLLLRNFEIWVEIAFTDDKKSLSQIGKVELEGRVTKYQKDISEIVFGRQVFRISIIIRSAEVKG